MTAASLVDSIGWTLLHFIWQGLLVGSVTALALSLLRNAHPAARYNAACTGLLVCLLWPAVELTLRIKGGNMVAQHMRYADALLTGSTNTMTATMVDFLQNQLLWIVGLWALCAAAMALRMALGLLWVARQSQSQSVHSQWQAVTTRLAHQFAVGRTVSLRVVEGIASPLTAGWLRPVVMLPASLITGMPRDLLEALLAHEMAHVRRFDYLVNLAQHVIEVLLFYHPAVWWISGRVRAERELVADDLAANITGEPHTLARALSELERNEFAHRQVALAANGGHLLSRVRRLVRPDRQVLNWKAALPIFGLAVACFAAYAHAASASVIDAQLDQRPIANFRSCAKPTYPSDDLKAGHEGAVSLAFLVDAEGAVRDARVDKSSGYAGLDQSARDAIRLCSFTPALKQGVAVRTWTKVQYVWTLK